MLPLLFALVAQVEVDAATVIPATRLIYLPGRFVHQCPGEVEVQEGVARRLGRTPFAEPPERLVVLALEGEGEAPERARAELFDKDMESLGARVIESAEGCPELVEAAELAISIALAPSLALAAPTPTTPTTAPAAPPEPVPIPVPEVEEPVDAAGESVAAADEPYMSWMPRGSKLRFGGGSHASIFFGPQEAVGWQFAVSMELGPWELSLEQRNDFPRWDGELNLLHGGGVNSLLACGEWDWFGDGAGGAIGVIGCASASTGSVWSFGSVTGVVPYAGLGGRVGASWRAWDADVLRVWTSMEWSAVRPSFAAYGNGQTGLWEQEAPVHVALGFTYEVAWP